MSKNDLFFVLEAPLDAPPSQRQVRSSNLGGLAGMVRHYGGDPLAVLERQGIDPGAMTGSDNHIPCQPMVDVLEDCGRRFNDTLFGLSLAERQDADVFGCVTALCRSAPTVRSGVLALAHYLPVVHSPECDLELVEGRETAELRWRPRTDFGASRQATYHATLLTIKVLRAIGGRDFQLAYASLTEDVRPRDISDFESRIGCAVHQQAATNAIGFRTDDLDRAVPSANNVLFGLIGGYLERLKVSSTTQIVDRVRQYVRGALSSGHCSIERCAVKLGMSVRALQANLALQETRFSDVLEQERINLAKIYLQRDALTLDDVASLLNYSDQTSFGRAFKRWTGTSPRRYQNGAELES